MKALTLLVITIIVIVEFSTLTNSALSQVKSGGVSRSDDGGSHGGGVIESEDTLLMRIQKDMSKIKTLADCEGNGCGVRDDECQKPDGCDDLKMGSLLKRIESRIES